MKKISPSICVQGCNWANYNDQPAELTLVGGLVRESFQNTLNSGLGIIHILPRCKDAGKEKPSPPKKRLKEHEL